MLYLGWIVAAFLLGLLAAQSAYRRRKRRTLRERLTSIPTFYGKTLAEVQRIARDAPYQTSRKANGQIVRTWRENDYILSLLFDACDVCLGVEEERDTRTKEEKSR